MKKIGFLLEVPQWMKIIEFLLETLMDEKKFKNFKGSIINEKNSDVHTHLNLLKYTYKSYTNKNG